MTNILQQLLELEVKATPGPWLYDNESIYAQDYQSSVAYASYGADVCISNEDAELLTNLRNNIRPIIKALLLAEEALEGIKHDDYCKEVYITASNALAAIEALKGEQS